MSEERISAQEESVDTLENTDNMLSVSKGLEVFRKNESLSSGNIREVAFDGLMNSVLSEIGSANLLDVVDIPEEQSLAIINAVKGIRDTKGQKYLVASFEDIPKDIFEKYKKGEYKVELSKQVENRLNPVIYDENGDIKKWIPLKKVVINSETLQYVNMAAIQQSLGEIKDELYSIGRDLKYAIDIEKSMGMEAPFKEAIEQLKRAANADDSVKKREFLSVAINKLIEGSSKVSADLERSKMELAIRCNDKKTKIRDIDCTMGYISDDLAFLQKYSGVKAYLYHILGEENNANDVIQDYNNTVKHLINDVLDEKGNTAVLLLHNYYPYSKKNTDFWLTKPQEICKQLEDIANGEKIEERVVFLLGETQEVES